MTTGRIFKFSGFMHINVGSKNMGNNCVNITRPGGQRLNKQISRLDVFVQPKAFELLMLET